jgi:hypothetical protein
MHGAQLAAFVFLPVLLFGLIPILRSFWLALDDQQFRSPVLCYTDLFQRPPPFRKN